MSWSRKFESPIPTSGKPLTTLKQAADFIMALPKSKQRLPVWQDATEALMMAAEGRGPLMLARIGMQRAINAGAVREPRRRRARKFNIITHS